MRGTARIMYVNSVGRLIAFIVLALLPVLPASATQLMFDVTGTRINHDSLVGQPGRYTTALWMNTSNVHPAYAWIPGQLDTVGSQEITLSGNGGKSLPFDLELRGVVYGSISGHFTLKDAPTGQSGGAGGAPKGNSYAIYNGGAQSYGRQMYESTSTVRYSPFTLVRPLFDLDPKALLDALKELPSGTYTAALPLSYRYKVQYEQGGVWTYEVRPLTLTLQVKYRARSLDEITVTGTGHITPEYGKLNNTVTGKTCWTVTAKGMMPAGISMRFMEPTQKFAMKQSVARVGDPVIPYNLTINNTNSVMGEGEPNVLVREGTLESGAETVIIKPASGIEQLEFMLNADFTSKYIPSGAYTDQFTVMFQVVIE